MKTELTQVAASLVAGVAGLPRQMDLHRPQYAEDQAFRKLFPESYTAGMKFPMLEDLINGEPFSTYYEFLDEMDWEV